MKTEIEYREDDIQKLCKAVLEFSPYCYDNPNRGYETRCPFCNAEEERDGTFKKIYAQMNELCHDSDCAYLIAKDLSTSCKKRKTFLK